MFVYPDSRVVVRNVFDHVQVSEDETVDFCVIMWIPQALSVLVQTTYSGLALGETKHHDLERRAQNQSGFRGKYHNSLRVNGLNCSGSQPSFCWGNGNGQSLFYCKSCRYTCIYSWL